MNVVTNDVSMATFFAMERMIVETIVMKQLDATVCSKSRNNDMFYSRRYSYPLLIYFKEILSKIIELGTCPLHNFSCKNKRCIQSTRVCNGVNDCLDNSDEEEGCQGKSFSCETQLCFSNQICNEAKHKLILIFLLIRLLRYQLSVSCFFVC